MSSSQRPAGSIPPMKRGRGSTILNAFAERRVSWGNRCVSKQKVSILVVVVAIGVVAGGFALASGRSTPSSAPADLSDGRVSLLARPRRAADALPVSVLRGPRPVGVEATPARLARQVGGDRQFVVRGAGKTEMICVVVVSGLRTWIKTCGSSEMLRNGAIYFTRPQAGGLVETWGIVGDGVIRVNDTRVQANAFAFTGKQDNTLKLSTATQTRSQPSLTSPYLGLGQFGTVTRASSSVVSSQPII